eukprot:CAMPEP_0198122982 /NCGR_PEP_ID=MMETSP1442-20131203/36387_1 /TAXON_ID= /ORGANISM="Craspedostauros australis, Strain CCMP3328" /LENGTH=69 /DNA_ID=CAMNT_0043782117 /DNA_START=155 /DNA_END=360 /DNA_ORIENTATION=+
MSNAAMSMPVFGSVSQPSQPALQPEGQATDQWNSTEGGADSMDFDLLAEYLLDDGPATASTMNFDFNGG